MNGILKDKVYESIAFTSQRKLQKILPKCPFCNGSAWVRRRTKEYLPAIGCMRVRFCGATVHGGNLLQAIRKWKKRPGISLPGLTKEETKLALDIERADLPPKGT